MCYRDMTFCTFWEKCKDNKKCGRALTDKIKEDADKWWGTKGEAPICTYVDKPECFKKI